MDRRTLVASIMILTIAISGGLRAAAVALGTLSEYAVEHLIVDRLSFLDADPSGEIVHRYVWEIPPETLVALELSAEFDGYLVVWDEADDWVAFGERDTDSERVNVTFEAARGGAYTLDVTSASGDETGEYALSARLFSGESVSDRGVDPPRRIYESIESPQTVPLHPGEIATVAMDVFERMHAYRVAPVHPESVYDVWLFSETDFDLYAAVLSDDAPLLEGASQEPFGYEHVRLVAAPGADALQVHVALYDEFAFRPVYSILVEERDGQGAAAAPASPGSGETMSLAGPIEPGLRLRGKIHPDVYGTQFWTLFVPPGVSSVEIGLFDAPVDMDLSVEPGWAPSIQGASHVERAISRRVNERIALRPTDGVPSGWYTVAVWPVISDDEVFGGPIEYGIEAAFDGTLPPSTVYDAVSRERLEAAPPVDLAYIATVWIEGDFHQGAGIIVSPDGHILTNYHVVADCHPAPQTVEGCLGEGQGAPSPLGSGRMIWMVNPRTGYGQQQFVATVVDVLPERDLALLKIRTTIDGDPVAGVLGEDPHLPYVRPADPIGTWPIDPRDLGAMTLLGFPRGEPSEMISSRTPVEIVRTVVSGGSPVLGYLATEGRPWHSGAPVVREGDGVLIGLVTGRAAAPLDDERDLWAVRLLDTIPAEWWGFIAGRNEFPATE